MPKQARARGRPRSKGRASADDREYLYGLGVDVMLRVRAERAVERWRKSLIRTQGYQFPAYLKIEEHMAAALEEMDKTVQALSRVPDSWKPAVGAVGGPLLEEGCMVEIKETAYSNYPFLDDPAQTMKVTAIHGSKIVCFALSNGQKIQTIFPKAHIRLAQDD